MIHIALLAVSLLSISAQTVLSYYVIYLWSPSAWLGTGVIFASAMFLVVVNLVFIGARLPHLRLADYVHQYFGRTLVLMLSATVLTGGLAIGLEALYQMDSLGFLPSAHDRNDVIYLLDCSSSMDMSFEGSKSARDAVGDALGEALNGMDNGRMITIVAYGDNAQVALDWTTMDDDIRSRVPQLVAQLHDIYYGGTSFDVALAFAQEQAEKLGTAKDRITTVMISDGEDQVSQGAVDVFVRQNMPIDTIYIGHDTAQNTLKSISEQTKGEYREVYERAALTAITQELFSAGNRVPDTLLTGRDRTAGVIAPFVMRPLSLFLLGFVIVLIGIILMGRNNSLLIHVLHAALFAAAGALFVEFGAKYGLPNTVLLGGYWLITMILVGRAEI